MIALQFFIKNKIFLTELKGGGEGTALVKGLEGVQRLQGGLAPGLHTGPNPEDHLLVVPDSRQPPVEVGLPRAPNPLRGGRLLNSPPALRGLPGVGQNLGQRDPVRLLHDYLAKLGI